LIFYLTLLVYAKKIVSIIKVANAFLLNFNY